MVKSVEGIYRNGKVELVDPLPEAEPQAADLRRRLVQFAEDWDRPEMAAYDELPHQAGHATRSIFRGSARIRR
jgi:hypothetical protein